MKNKNTSHKDKYKSEIKYRDNKSSKIPLLFIIFFATFIILDIIFIYIAQHSYQGIATDKAYSKGVKYNEVLSSNLLQKEIEKLVNTEMNLQCQEGKNLRIHNKTQQRYNTSDQNTKTTTICDLNITISNKNPKTDINKLYQIFRLNSKTKANNETSENNKTSITGLISRPATNLYDITIKHMSCTEENHSLHQIKCFTSIMLPFNKGAWDIKIKIPLNLSNYKLSNEEYNNIEHINQKNNHFFLYKRIILPPNA